MAVKDSNFLIFFSCHVIQTLICLHISYLGMKRRMSKIVIFRRQLGSYQTTPVPVLSAVHQRLCEWNVTHRNCTTKRDRIVQDSNSQTNVQTPRLQSHVCFFAFFWGSFHLGGLFLLKDSATTEWAQPQTFKNPKALSPRHSGFNSLWNHGWLGSIHSLLKLQS